MALHLIKLSVGATCLDDLRDWQSRHALARPPLRHSTRNFPRRKAEILDGGSIYWVINRIITARQRILDIAEGLRDDGTPCTDLILDPALIQVHPQFKKPFQGWRYLPDTEAPPDAALPARTDLPESLKRELAALCLL